MTDKESLDKLIHNIGSFGLQPDGSYTRLPFSAAYNEAANYIKELLINANVNTYIDSVGNVIGTLDNKKNHNKNAIMIGSHIDTVKNGGLFDGTLGLACAIYCIYKLQSNKITLNHPLMFVGFQGEEGSDLGGTFGSRCMAGLINSYDDNYKSVLNKYNITEEDIQKAKIDLSKKKCFLEVHTELGKKLEIHHNNIGIVTGIVGITRYRITVTGEKNHAGTTPMEFRKDALTSAARMLVYISNLAISNFTDLVATVGKLQISPGAVTVIPGRVDFILEIRHMNQEIINQFVENIIEHTKLETGFTYTFEKIIEKHSVCCDSSIQKHIENNCRALKYSYEYIPSGAGHDGNSFGQRLPIGMIFVPSKDGIGHSKNEWTSIDQAFEGANLLYNTIISLDAEQ